MQLRINSGRADSASEHRDPKTEGARTPDTRTSSSSPARTRVNANPAGNPHTPGLLLLLLPTPAFSPTPPAAALKQVHHSVSHKCCVIFAYSLLWLLGFLCWAALRGALSSNLHSKNTRDDISYSIPSPPPPLLCYAFCLLFAAARPLLTLKCIFYGNFKCSIPIPLPACLQISAACPAIINVRKCIVYVA